MTAAISLRKGRTIDNHIEEIDSSYDPGGGRAYNTMTEQDRKENAIGRSVSQIYRTIRSHCKCCCDHLCTEAIYLSNISYRIVFQTHHVKSIEHTSVI